MSLFERTADVNGRVAMVPPMRNGFAPEAPARVSAAVKTVPGASPDDYQVTPDDITPRRLDELNSAKALPRFKRVLTASDDTIQISETTRKHFVAVDLQASVAVVIATRAFKNTAQYWTLVRNLEHAQVQIHSELCASEAVIAEIYRSGVDLYDTDDEDTKSLIFFRDLIEVGNRLRASDIKLEVRWWQERSKVRFRIHGKYRTWKFFPNDQLVRAFSAAYGALVAEATNSAPSFQATEAQSAMIPIIVGRDFKNLRWQSTPEMMGFDVSLRLLDGNYKNVSVLTFEEQGFAPSQIAIFVATLARSGGMFLTSGPTGSGKTTLLRTASYEWGKSDDKNMYAVQDPPEYPQPWLSEIPIQRKADEEEQSVRRKYLAVLRVIVRSDPDALVLGEIRDRETVQIAIEFTRTGHPLLSSVHADGGIEVYQRLGGDTLGVAADDLASRRLIGAVTYQRLMPVLCRECKLEATGVLTPELQHILSSKYKLNLGRIRCINPEGCDACRVDGIKDAKGIEGVTVVAEVIEPTYNEAFRECIGKRDWSGAERAWRQTRKTAFDDEDMTGKTAFEHALYKVSIGLIDPREIDSDMERLDRYQIFPMSGEV